MVTISEWEGKNVLITGGLGFIGSSLSHRLVDEGAAVTIVDACLPEYGANPVNIKGIRDKVQVRKRDVRTKKEIQEPVTNADVIYHCAAQLSRTESMENPRKDTEINCQGLLNVLDICADLADPPKVVFPSSQAVVGKPDSLPISENTPASPIDIYGANKRAGEMYCEIYDQARDVPTTVARLTNVYGPRAQLKNPNYGVINQFISSGIVDDTLTVFQPGTMTRDFVYIEDVVDALCALGMANQTRGFRYLVGSSTSTSILELAEKIVDISGKGEVKLVEWPDDWDTIKIGDIRADPTTLQNAIGWRPKVCLIEGLELTIEYYKDHIEKYM